MAGKMKWAIALLIGFSIIVLGWKLTDSRWFSWLLTVFFVLNCTVLIIVVLLQSGKAADLAGAFGGAGSQTAFGPRGAASVLSRATTWCAIMFMFCALALVLRTEKGVTQGSSILQKVSKSAPKPVPVTPVSPQSNSYPSLPQSAQPAANQPPAQSAPATAQPVPAQPKKP